jgi:hypothetical protein
VLLRARVPAPIPGANDRTRPREMTDALLPK